jgi:hypothetical protein
LISSICGFSTTLIWEGSGAGPFDPLDDLADLILDIDLMLEDEGERGRVVLVNVGDVGGTASEEGGLDLAAGCCGI